MKEFRSLEDVERVDLPEEVAGIVRAFMDPRRCNAGCSGSGPQIASQARNDAEANVEAFSSQIASQAPYEQAV